LEFFQSFYAKEFLMPSLREHNLSGEQNKKDQSESKKIPPKKRTYNEVAAMTGKQTGTKPNPIADRMLTSASNAAQTLGQILGSK
jgi:hypothetical protein